MTTQEFRTTGAQSFDDGGDDFDLEFALETHLVEPTVLEGEEATWIDAPVGMVVSDAESEIVDLDELEIPIEELPSDEIPVDVEAAEDDSDPNDSFGLWLRALVSAAEGSNMFIGLAALRNFVSEGRVGRRAFPYHAAESLAEANIARLEGEELVATAAFLRVLAEWRRVLAGEGGDFSKCGTRTFDEWSADLLSRILGAPARFESTKRELRKRGVAAFGLVENAA